MAKKKSIFLEKTAKKPKMKSLKVAAVQMNSSTDKNKNLQFVAKKTMEARAKGAQLVAFPENMLVLREGARAMRSEAESINGPSVRTLQTIAKEAKVHLLTGTLPIKSSRGVYNTALLISNQGKMIARYDKMHLFDVQVSGDRAYRESNTYLPGRRVVTTKALGIQMGMSICYDLRFPELYRRMAKQGLDLIFVPSAFTVPTGRAHWHALLRARAIENQCYVVAPAQGGTHDEGRKTFGHSLIVDPWGRILAEKARGPGVILASLDFGAMKDIRKSLPSLANRQLR